MLALACTPFAALHLPSLAQGRAPIGEFLELIFVAIFLLVPVIRGIFQGKKEEDKTTGPRRGPPADEDVAGPKRDKTHSREFWEKLLKGETPPTAEELMERKDGGAYSSTTRDMAPVEAKVEPIATAPSRKAATGPPRGSKAEGRKRASAGGQKERPGPKRGSLVQLKGLQRKALNTPSSTPKAPAARTASPESAPDSALGSGMGTVMGSGIGPGLGERLESHVGGLVGSDEEVRTSTPGESGKRKAFDRPTGSREWRRAMVLSEIVAPPLALRDLDDGMGTPPGLR